jgi:hypothetical protein
MLAMIEKVWLQACRPNSVSNDAAQQAALG